MKRSLAAIMFTDVAGYSALSEPQLRVFLDSVLPDLAQVLEPHRPALIELNTWGDAIVAVSADPYLLARLSLDIRDYFRNRNWPDSHLPETLACRIALHAGAIFLGTDPIRQRDGIVGTQVNLAARIEPVTVPGQVWVTEQFMRLLDATTDSKLAFDDLGERPLAKKFGSTRLWCLRRSSDSPQQPPDTQVLTADGPPVPRELELAIHIAKHGNEAQRRVALDILDKFNVTESVAALVEVARDTKAPHTLRKMAVDSLAVLRSRSAVPDLISIVEDKESIPDLVGHAMEALGVIGDVRAVPCIQAAILGDRPLEVNAVRAGLIALAKIGDPKAIPILKAVFEQMQRFSAALTHAISACAIIRDDSLVPYLQTIARDKIRPPKLRGLALSALTLTSPALSEDLFVELVQDQTENSEIRFWAVGSLASVPGARSTKILQDIAGNLADPLCARALVVLTKGPDLLKEQESELMQSAAGKA